MLLFWRIRYLDTGDRNFKNRDLWLDTDTIDPVMKVAVEATHATKDPRRGRDMVRYRQLFRERNETKDAWKTLCDRDAGMGTVFIHDYFEDEAGEELTFKQMAVVLTGNPQAVLFAPGTRQHDIDFCLAEKQPIHLEQITISADLLNVLGYFVRDLRELLATAFYNDGPGSLSRSGPGSTLVLKTAISDEEIRSFVTIFRRLYMDKEPANFANAVAVFATVLPDQPVAKWVQAIAREYEEALEREPDSVPMLGPQKLPFTRKRLIDVYLYTQYAHQPDDRRTQQFNVCLAAVGRNRSSLTWLFLTEVWKCALEIRNAGVMIANFFDRYCQCHSVPCSTLSSVRNDNPGIGVLEKNEAQEARIYREKSEELARILWERAGRPEVGCSAFVQPALEKLMAATGRTGVGRA